MYACVFARLSRECRDQEIGLERVPLRQHQPREEGIAVQTKLVRERADVDLALA